MTDNAKELPPMTPVREALKIAIEKLQKIESDTGYQLDGDFTKPEDGFIARLQASLSAAPGEPSMSVESALAYADGYKEGLDDCERADVGKLIEQVAALEGKLSFEKALKSDAERRFAEQAAYVAELEDKQRAIHTTPQPAAGWDEAIEAAINIVKPWPGAEGFAESEADKAVENIRRKLVAALKALRRTANDRLQTAVTIVVPDGYKNAEEFLRDCCFERAEPLSARATFDQIIASLHYYGDNINSLTVGEIRRAL